jgi:transposase InsO family protein
MQEQGLIARKKRRFVRTTDSRHDLPIADNLLGRDFEAEAPNRIWVTDITYIWTVAGWLYLAAIVDLFSRKVVGWATSTSIDRTLVLRALEQALARRGPVPGLIHHSDRGSQYACHDYRKALRARGIDCSMSRKGDCWDNAVAESFFATLKQELIHRQQFTDQAQATSALFEYIEVFYNRKRRHSYLDYQSPENYETNFYASPCAA